MAAGPHASLGNDRWRAAFMPDRIGRYEFTVEAWIDKYGTLCRDLEVKRAAGADISVEAEEARQLLMRRQERTEDGASNVIDSALEWLRDASARFQRRHSARRPICAR